MRVALTHLTRRSSAAPPARPTIVPSRPFTVLPLPVDAFGVAVSRDATVFVVAAVLSAVGRLR